MLLRDIFSLQRVISAILLVVLSVIGVELFHWAVGFFVSILIALEAGALARVSLWQKYSQKLYEKYEAKILAVIEKYPAIFKAIRSRRFLMTITILNRKTSCCRWLSNPATC